MKFAVLLLALALGNCTRQAPTFSAVAIGDYDRDPAAAAQSRKFFDRGETPALIARGSVLEGSDLVLVISETHTGRVLMTAPSRKLENGAANWVYASDRTASLTATLYKDGKEFSAVSFTVFR